MSKWGKVDFSELKKLQKQIQRAERNMMKMQDEIAIKIGNEFLQEVIERTPKSENNTLRNHWKLQILRNKASYTVVVYNDLEYASMVEFGHKTDNGGWKQGYFMMTITEQDIEKKMNNLATPIIDKYLGEIFK